MKIEGCIAKRPVAVIPDLHPVFSPKGYKPPFYKRFHLLIFSLFQYPDQLCLLLILTALVLRASSLAHLVLRLDKLILTFRVALLIQFFPDLFKSLGDLLWV